MWGAGNVVRHIRKGGDSTMLMKSKFGPSQKMKRIGVDYGKGRDIYI